MYVLLLDRYDHPVLYRGVFSTHELAEAAMRKLELAEIADFGYSHDYVIRAVRLDSGE
ncbi:MAG TPA: hypothetical protein VLA24_03730 [Pseudomonadales bacterium]|nr:hypothetical protein [Pseudomonadales bacterium]